MSNDENNIKLKGKFIISGTITTITGLHIGGSNIGLEIGGADMVVVRDPLTNKPYIPGSSLKGALRSNLERAGKDDGTLYTLIPVVGAKEREDMVMIHICKGDNAESEYPNCPVCNIFGVSGDVGYPIFPGRLVVRDAFMDDTATEFAKKDNLDMPYSEVKTEVVIDRITSKATPRQLERVPAGAEFKFEMVFNIYKEGDENFLKHLFSAMKLLEDDYLGGQGSRGSGKIRFGKFERDEENKEVNLQNLKEGMKIVWRPAEYYLKDEKKEQEITVNNVKITPSDYAKIKGKIKEIFEKQDDNKI